MQASAGLEGGVWHSEKKKKVTAKRERKKRNVRNNNFFKRQWALERKRWDN